MSLAPGKYCSSLEIVLCGGSIVDSQLRVYKSTAILDPIFVIRAQKVSHFINANIPEDLKAKQMPQNRVKLRCTECTVPSRVTSNTQFSYMAYYRIAGVRQSLDLSLRRRIGLVQLYRAVQ